MIVQHGNVLAEKWIGEGKEDEPHILSSVSKTFTASDVYKRQELPLTWEQEKMLRDEFEQSFVKNKVVFEETL